MHQPDGPFRLKLLSKALRKIPARTGVLKQIRACFALTGSADRTPQLIFVHVAFQTVDSDVSRLARLDKIAAFVSGERVKNWQRHVALPTTVPNISCGPNRRITEHRVGVRQTDPGKKLARWPMG